MSTKSYMITSVALGVLLFTLACAGSSSFREGTSNQAGGSAEKLTDWRIDPWLADSQSKVVVEVVETQTGNDRTERQAFLKIDRQSPILLGPLKRHIADAPLETLFLEIDGDRFVIAWVDESVDGDLSTLSLERPYPQYDSDDHGRATKAAEIVNRVSIIPISVDERDLWEQISAVLINTSDELGYKWTEDFSPPLSIDHLFNTIPQS